jgi:hypothetical protein
MQKNVPQVDREGGESAATVPALTYPFILFLEAQQHQAEKASQLPSQ